MTLEEIISRAADCGFYLPAKCTKEEAIALVIAEFEKDPEQFDKEQIEEETDDEDMSPDFSCVECGKELLGKEMDKESNKCASCYNKMDDESEQLLKAWKI